MSESLALETLNSSLGIQERNQYGGLWYVYAAPFPFTLQLQEASLSLPEPRFLGFLGMITSGSLVCCETAHVG